MASSGGNTPLKTLCRRRPPYHAVREKSNCQEVNTSETTRKGPGATSYLKNLVVSPLSTESIEWPPISPPSEAYLLRAPGIPISRPKHRPLRLSRPKSATRQQMGTQGNSRSIRGIGLPPPVSRQSGAVSVLGAQHADLRTHSTTSFLRRFLRVVYFVS